jgi:hypothetical protein
MQMVGLRRLGSLACRFDLCKSAARPRPHIVRVFEDGRFVQILYGDPDREGGHYVIRIGNDDGQVVFPHRHPEDEHIVVIQGTWFMEHGEVFDRQVLEEMPVGTYGVVPKTMPPLRLVAR